MALPISVFFLLTFCETQPMSAKNYLTTTLFVLLFVGTSSLFAQNDTENIEDLKINKEDKPQFLIRTQRNGKVKYVECALPSRYFYQATTSVANESLQSTSEFTAKGGADAAEDYFGFTFFLVQDGVIKACNESGDFNGQPGGVYSISRFSHPLSISPESFAGAELKQ